MRLVKNNIVAVLTIVTMLFSTTALTQSGEATPKSGLIDPATGESKRIIELRKGPGDPVAGYEKSELCQGCHGEFGNSTAPLIPKLAGQYGGYIIKQVLDYQAGTRSHQIMNAMAGTIDTDEDLADIAAYFAIQRKMKGKRFTDNQLGKFIYSNGDVDKKRVACVNCHGVWGRGLDPKTSMFPVIGGQHKEYIKKQLYDFRDNTRTNSATGVMSTIARSMTDAEIEAVSEYVSTR